MALKTPSMRSIFAQLPVDQVLVNRPKGLRSIAVSQRGNARYLTCGKHRSYCVATPRRVYKTSD